MILHLCKTCSIPQPTWDPMHPTVCGLENEGIKATGYVNAFRRSDNPCPACLVAIDALLEQGLVPQ